MRVERGGVMTRRPGRLTTWSPACLSPPSQLAEVLATLGLVVVEALGRIAPLTDAADAVVERSRNPPCPTAERCPGPLCGLRRGEGRPGRALASANSH
jgi:hypothetical protein